MARLPDSQALGERPVPQPRGGIPSISNAGVAEGVQAQASTKGVVEFADQLAKAGEKIQQREESIARLKDLDTFETTANEEARRLAAEGDLSRIETVKEFGGFLRNLETNTLSGHQGRDESKIKLSGRLQEIRGNLSSQIALKSSEAVRKKNTEIYGRNLNQLSMQVYDDPGQFDNAVNKFNSIVDDSPESPDFKTAHKLAGLGEIAESAVKKFIESGAIADIPGAMNDAMDILDDAQVRQALGEPRRNRILNGLAAARRPVKPSEFSEKMGAAGFDLNNPTAESQQFARDIMLKPQVSITQQAETKGRGKLGELDAERVNDLTSKAVAANQKLASIDRMKTALDTGGFRVGSFGEERATLARLAEFLGAPDEIKNLIGSAKAADTLDTAAKQLIISQIPEFGRRTLATEVKLLQEAGPALWRSEGGLRILLDVFERGSNREIQTAEIARDIFEEKGSLQSKERNFLAEIRKLEKDDPIVSDEIKEKIKSEVIRAPASVEEGLRQRVENTLKGLNIPGDWGFVRMEEGGMIVLKNKKTGEEKTGPVSSLRK